jgi:hypothetical protein
MKISYQKGFASNYVYNQTIRCETLEEFKAVLEIIKPNRFYKDNKTHIEI